MGTAMNKARFTLNEIYDAERDPVIIRQVADLVERQYKADPSSLVRDNKRVAYLRAIADKIEQEKANER